GGGGVGGVGGGVVGVGGGEEGQVQQADGRRQHLGPRQAVPAEVRGHAGPQGRQGPAEREDAVVLGPVAHGPPAGVVAVLLAAAAGAAGCPGGGIGGRGGTPVPAGRRRGPG